MVNALLQQQLGDICAGLKRAGSIQYCAPPGLSNKTSAEVHETVAIKTGGNAMTYASSVHLSTRLDQRGSHREVGT
jgi:hypothetical protein